MSFRIYKSRNLIGVLELGEEESALAQIYKSRNLIGVLETRDLAAMYFISTKVEI